MVCKYGMGQVPLGLALTWAYAFLLTESKVYSYKGCDFSQRGNTTAVLTAACQRHMTTMLSCRTDVSNALSTSAWFRFPYPFQWGVPTFKWQTGVIMIVASVIASVDSVCALPKNSIVPLKCCAMYMFQRIVFVGHIL